MPGLRLLLWAPPNPASLPNIQNPVRGPNQKFRPWCLEPLISPPSPSLTCALSTHHCLPCPVPHTHLLQPGKQTCCSAATHVILSASRLWRSCHWVSLGLSCSGAGASMPGIPSAVACPLFSMASLSSCRQPLHGLPGLEAFAEPFLSWGPVHICQCPVWWLAVPRTVLEPHEGARPLCVVHPEHLTVSVCAGSLRTTEPQPTAPFSHGLVRQILVY